MLYCCWLGFRNYIRHCSFVHHGWLGCWHVTCFQPPPALRPRTGPTCNPSNTGACTVYFKSPALPVGFSVKVPMVRPCPTSRAAGTSHLLSTPAALATPRRPQSGCDGLSQFKRTQPNPLYLPENLIS